MKLRKGAIVGIVGGILAIVGVTILPWWKFALVAGVCRDACTGLDTGLGGDLLLIVAVLGLAAVALEKEPPLILRLVFGTLTLVLAFAA